MTANVFLAVIGAALLHASWNALVKSGADKTLSMGAVILGHVPFALVAIALVPLPASESLPLMALSVVLHFGYQIFLLNSYKIGDLTQVYPIARGVAPLIVAAVSVLLLGVQLLPMQILGIVVIGSGILSLSLVRRADGLRNGKAAGLALITGCFIASYSLVDGTGARLAGTAVGFYAWQSLFNAAGMSLYLAATAPGVFRDMAGRKGRMVFWVGGGASFLAYAIVTWAFTQAPIALVTALRETSIVFALVIGVVFLKERLDLVKVISTMTTLLGAVLLRFAK